MILPDYKIHEWALANNVSPYNKENLNPASLDLTLWDIWRDFDRQDKIILSEEIELYPASFVLKVYNWFADRLPWLLKRKMTAVMATTHEWICLPDNMAAEIKLKTTPAREGVGFIAADWVDPGYEGRLTLIITALRKTKLCNGQRIVQIVLYRTDRVQKSYALTGHYNRQEVPTVSWRKNNQ